MVKYAREDTHYLLYIYDRYGFFSRLCPSCETAWRFTERNIICSFVHTSLIRLRNEAVARGNETNNILRVILERSRDVSLQVYEKEIITDTSYLELYHKYDRRLDDRQLRVFAALFKWRDERARLDDESVRYVLPTHMMFLIAETSPP